ncbi:histidinol-phosphatase [Campylobacter sp. 19-13652]|uniref:histidinol-phosphatase n=1 Tax=Campylobacter sp. 19-13652 TaxID=2840180 RepID=UPI001C78B114|nr:histidinol-phosphatase [Campylobacter sp. 19-13652]BCX79359.1 putative histidinol-phosphatase [Campylobacter sp. 19-13652]
MIVDLHNHTTRCNHATGSMQEYVQMAIKNGIKIFGFSDHAPMEFDKKWRMGFSQMADYESEAKILKERFKADIEVLLGYEVDYLRGLIDERVLKAEVDYLIGSVHFLGKWGFDNPEFIGEYQNRNIDAIWQEYFGAIEDMAKSGLFDIVGHIDLLKVFKFMPKKDVRILAKNALKAIKKAGLVVEINAAGFRKMVAEQYPSLPLLQEIYALDIPITFGSDAHAVEQVGAGGAECERIARQVGYLKCSVFKGRDMDSIKF